MQRTLLGPLCRCRAFFPRKLRTGPLCRRNADSRLGTASKILGGRLYPQIQDGKDRCAHPRYLGALQMGKESAVRRQFHNGAWLGPYAWLDVGRGFYCGLSAALLPYRHTGRRGVPCFQIWAAVPCIQGKGAISLSLSQKGFA